MHKRVQHQYRRLLFAVNAIAIFALAFSVGSVFFGSGLVSAHTGGFTYEAVVNEYFVDIGANRQVIAPNELTLFEFNLYPQSDPNTLAMFDSVYVTISDKESGVIYAGPVHRPGEAILTVMSFSFPSEGEYLMSARFDKEGSPLAEVEFSVPVTVSSEENRSSAAKVIVLALIISAVIFAIYAKFLKT